MSDFIRRMLSSSLMLRAPEGEAGTPEPEAGTNAGAEPAEPAAGAIVPEAGTAGTEPVESAGASSPTPGTEGGTTPATTPVAPDRAQQRMNQLVAERWAERRRAEEAENRSRLLQEQLNQTREALQPTVDAQGNPVAPTASAQARREAPQDLQAMAAQIAANNDFNRQVQDEVTKGRGSHQDFDQVASNLQRFGELPRTFVEAAMATGKGADVMYHLGGDIAEADRILSLPPIQQAVALATLAQTIKPTVVKTVTSAPNPVTPKVGGGKTINTPTLEDENMSTEAWIALREKQLAQKKTDQRAARR